MTTIPAVVAAALVAACASQANAVTVVPTFDSSITGNADAAQIEAAVDQVTNYYRTFTNDANGWRTSLLETGRRMSSSPPLNIRLC